VATEFGKLAARRRIGTGISPYRTVRQARAFVAALRETVEELGGG
jgi:hypothetical protein